MPEPRTEGFVPGPHPIDSYGDGGFRFADMSHRGSILALPSGVHAWAAVAPQDIDVESLALVFAEPEGSIDLLILGTGQSLVFPAKALRDRLAAAHISVEPMATNAAISTYNILLGEGRNVAAALLAVG